MSGLDGLLKFELSFNSYRTVARNRWSGAYVNTKGHTALC